MSDHSPVCIVVSHRSVSCQYLNNPNDLTDLNGLNDLKKGGLQ